MDISVLPTFLATILIFLAPPGPDMIYMLTVGLKAGPRAAIRAISGIGTGMAVYALIVTAGLGGVIAAAPNILLLIKIVGSGYLFWLGSSTLRSAQRNASHTDNETVLENETGWYRQGLIVSATNPKILLFFLAVLPRFLGDATNTTAQLAMLGAVNVATEVVLYGTIGVFAGQLTSKINPQGRVSRIIEYIAAAVYFGLGLVILGEALMN